MLTLRERKKRATRQRVIDVAVRLFQRQGYDNTSVDEIAEQADISRATFFNYFENKERVLYEIALDELTILNRVAHQSKDDLVSPVARIYAVLNRLIADSLPFLEIARYVILGAALHPSDETAFHLRLGNILFGLVSEAQDMGEIRPDLEAGAVVHALTGTYLALLFEQLVTVNRQQVPRADAAYTNKSKPSLEKTVRMIFEGVAGPEYTPQD